MVMKKDRLIAEGLVEAWAYLGVKEIPQSITGCHSPLKKIKNTLGRLFPKEIENSTFLVQRAISGDLFVLKIALESVGETKLINYYQKGVYEIQQRDYGTPSKFSLTMAKLICDEMEIPYSER